MTPPDDPLRAALTPDELRELREWVSSYHDRHRYGGQAHDHEGRCRLLATLDAALQQPARSEGLDVERLARALDVDWSPAWHELPIEERSGVGMVEAGWDKRELAALIAREYAALSAPVKP